MLTCDATVFVGARARAAHRSPRNERLVRVGALIVQAARHRCHRRQHSATKKDKEPRSAETNERFIRYHFMLGGTWRQDGRKTHTTDITPYLKHHMLTHVLHSSRRQCTCPCCTRHPHPSRPSSSRTRRSSRTSPLSPEKIDCHKGRQGTSVSRSKRTGPPHSTCMPWTQTANHRGTTAVKRRVRDRVRVKVWAAVR